jgi:hypothetical protein
VADVESVVDLADRVVDARKASVGYAVVLIAFAASANSLAHRMYETLDETPRAVEVLRAQADPEPPPPAASPSPLVIVLLDGMRVDESRRSPPIEALRDRGAHGLVELTEVPTLSRPYYHALLTGVPQRGSGVRRNKPGQRQVFDALPDRVRAAGGDVAFVAEDLDWMSVLFARAGDVDHHGPDALDGPLSAVLDRVEAGDGPTLTVVHVLGVDETAHDFGIDSDPHREALGRADEVVSRVSEATFGRAFLAVVSDHGHIPAGGHGGDEDDVRFAPFVFVGDGVARGEVERPLAVEELAPTFASWIGVAPPRSSVVEAAPELAGPAAVVRPLAQRRFTLLEAATDAERASRLRRLGWLVPLVLLLSVMGLGATKRSFRALDAGTFIAPLVVAAGVFVVHRYVLERPFTLSALDHATNQGLRVGAIAAAFAVVAIPFAAAVARRRRHEPFVMHLRRAAAGVGWASLTFTAWVLALTGGALGPWPPTAFDVYAPILGFAAGGAAALVAAIALISTTFTRSTSPVDPPPAL